MTAPIGVSPDIAEALDTFDAFAKCLGRNEDDPVSENAHANARAALVTAIVNALRPA